MPKNIPFSTILVSLLFLISLFGLFTVSSFDTRSFALTSNPVPVSKYNMFYQINADQNSMISSDKGLKAAIIKSVNSLSAKSNDEVYLMDLIAEGPSFIGIVKVGPADNQDNGEGYLSGTQYKFLYVKKTDGTYDYTNNSNLTSVRSMLSTSFARSKLSKETLVEIDNLLYEGNSSLFQTKASSPFSDPVGSVNGVTYKFPWASNLGEWKITGSWHGGFWNINGAYYKENAIDVRSDLFTPEFEAKNEVDVLSPISGIINSRCNYDPYNNGYIVIKGDDGMYYTVIHIKVNSMTVKSGARVLQGQKLGVMFEDGLNQDRWSGGYTSGRCAWANGTHLHLGMIPVNNNNLVNGVRIYNLDGLELHLPDNNGNARIGTVLKSTQQSTVTVNPSTSSSTSTTSTANNVIKIIPKFYLNTRTCADAIYTCKLVYPTLAPNSSNEVKCKFVNSKNVTWVRIDKNSLESTTNNRWVIASSYYANITINSLSTTVSDSRIPICPSGNL